MKAYVKMTDREYKDFRMYTCEKMGFNPDSRRDYTSDYRGQEAEDWLLKTGKIALKERVDTRNRKYNDVYLVIHGSEEYINEVVEILFTAEIYTNALPDRFGKVQKTILANRNLQNRIIREV